MALQDTIDIIERQKRLIPNLSAFATVFGSTELFKEQQKRAAMAMAFQPPAHVIQMMKSISMVSESEHKIAAILANAEKNNPFLSNKFFQLNSSQQRLIESLAKASKMSLPLQGIESALNGFSTSFIQAMAKRKDWSDIDVIEQANETIITNTDRFTNSLGTLEIQDFSELLQSIVTGLRKVLSKTKSKLSKQFIFNFLTIFSVLWSLYTYHHDNKDKKQTNQQFHNLQLDVTQIKENTEDKSIIDTSHIRFATIDVPLRFSGKSNSKVINVVQKDQQVNVVQILHKYLFIAYIDKNTKAPFCGFVLKKYFTSVLNKH